MVKLIMSELIGKELRSRAEAKKVLDWFDSYAKNDVVIDYVGVRFISRSFADELCGIIEDMNKLYTISEIDQSINISTTMRIVRNGRNKPKDVKLTGDTVELTDMKSLAEFLATI
jgi:hypothetical protein